MASLHRSVWPALVVAVFAATPARAFVVAPGRVASHLTKHANRDRIAQSKPQQQRETIQTRRPTAVVAAAKKTTRLEEASSQVPRNPVRVVGVLALWAGLILYAAFAAPGKDAASQALDADLLAKLITDPFDPSVNPLFCVLFNFMGLWPLIFASLLWPGRKGDQPVPAAPFLLGSVAFGTFALSPYVALRRLETTVAKPTGPVGRVLESSWLAGALAVGAVALTASELGGGDASSAISGFLDLFHSQLFVHVTSLDFCALWILSFDVLKEDLDRRPDADPSLLALALVPIYGHLVYLLLRPSLPDSASDDTVL